ncbi:MAG: hypothetical protein C5B51_18650 [Terriglobia bacterium]|nr:MAG: hypothetical protein C5B51_18650 [Terriglobia bacterium]
MAATKKKPAPAKAKSKKKAQPAPRPKPKRPAKAQPLDLSAFPAESLTSFERRICLACVLDVFTRHLGLALKTAHLEIRRHAPPLAELQGPDHVRPYFPASTTPGACPYCAAPPKWHAQLRVYRIESGKATDALRRELVKSLPKSEDQFLILEEKATQQHAFFEWLEKISGDFDLDQPGWLREVSKHYLSRKEPKVDWQALFGPIHAIRRSRRLDSGWEVDAGRLFLAPLWFDELLLVQYLVSRSQKAGGLTLEGRYTLPELFARLRKAGYLRAMGVEAHTPADALEALVAHLSGGESSLRFYYIVDRREFLEKAKALKLLKPPKPKLPQTLARARGKGQ